jgi:hypothetical protein
VDLLAEACEVRGEDRCSHDNGLHAAL